jgi:hypothetical protein
MAESGGLSWEAQEVFQKIKSFGRLPGSGVPLIQLNMRVGSAKTVKKGIPELKSAGPSLIPLQVSRCLRIKVTRPPSDLPPQSSSCGCRGCWFEDAGGVEGGAVLVATWSMVW